MHLLLWMMDEAGEVGDVIRKQGLEEPEVRRHFVEEMCDVRRDDVFQQPDDLLLHFVRRIGGTVPRQAPPKHDALVKPQDGLSVCRGP